MAKSLLAIALLCAAAANAYGSRSLTQALADAAPPVADPAAAAAAVPLPGVVPAPSPTFAPAPTATINGVGGFSCVSPGVTGYLFQPDPCRFGAFAGNLTYCDLTTENSGVVGIRNLSVVACTTTNSCPTGHFCSQQTARNRTCTPVADVLCFAGALPPSPGPGPAAAPLASGPLAAAPVVLPLTPPTQPDQSTTATIPTTTLAADPATLPATPPTGSK
jgi:hypothetical protein